MMTGLRRTVELSVIGLDYALTEVVRCKSRQERGVPEALGTCSSRYLARTLELSAARVFPRRLAHILSHLPEKRGASSSKATQERPLSRTFGSRGSDSNRGPLHYELWAAVTTSHQESPQVALRAEFVGLEMTHGDPR